MKPPPEHDAEIGARIKDERERLGIDRLTLAHASQVHYKWLSALENKGIPRPNPEKVDRILSKLKDYAEYGGVPEAERWYSVARSLIARFRRAALFAESAEEQQIAQDFVRGLEEFEACKPGLFKEITHRHLEESIAVIFGATRHWMHVSTHAPAPVRVWKLLIEEAREAEEGREGEMIRAASAIHPEIWWHGLMGDSYLASNERKIQRGVVTRRIFIYDGNDRHEMERLDGSDGEPGLLKKNVDAGVHVHKVPWSSALGAQNLLIIGDRYAGRLDVQDRRFIRGYDIIEQERDIEIRAWQKEFDALFSQLGTECVLETFKPPYHCDLLKRSSS